ncbi:MAG: hemerythrin domain-containing protein [Planctomycetes bacterium]|nr:hemerythrin domain-containing protein [Planctomycetota bacterium]
MPIPLGWEVTHDFTTPLGLLSDCHRRVERFLDVLARVAAAAREGVAHAEYRSALQGALDYFQQAAPRHTQDEEESLFPRLRAKASRDDRAARAVEIIARLEGDHRRAEIAHAQVEAIGRAWLASGEVAREVLDRFTMLAHELRALFATHIPIEDQELFPLAAKVLDAGEIAALGREMAARRGLS